MKNIIICSDGTWQSPESDTSTHILRIARGIAPDHTGPQHNEYTGFYRTMRRRIVRDVEPVVHVSVQLRWEDDGVRYRSTNKD